MKTAARGKWRSFIALAERISGENWERFSSRGENASHIFLFSFFSPLVQVFVCARVRPQICPSVPRRRAAPQVQLIHKIVGMHGVQRMFNSNFIVQALLFVCAETEYATRYARGNVTRTFIQNTATRFVCASRECNSLLNLLYPVWRPRGREDLRVRVQ